MFKINAKDIDEYEDHLKAFGHRAFPFATKATLNTAAFTAQKLARKDINVKMITRNQFTERSILVDQARTLTVSRQSATVGSTADYMETQEFGGTKHKTGKEGVAIATGYSAGQDGQQPRTKLPRKPNRLANIRLRKRSRKGKNKKQDNGFKIWDSITNGKRFVFLDTGRRKGIYRIVGGSRHNVHGARLRMVADMTKQSVNIPRNPWLKPAVDRTQILMPDMYTDALRFQLKRLRLFR